MEHLAKQLASDIRLLSHYLEAVGHPHPSFDRQAPPTALPEGAPENIQLSRERIIDNALQLFNLAAGPREFLINLSTGCHYIACLRWLCHFNIFALVPLEGSISYSQLAAMANVSEAPLKSIARMAMTTHLLCEPFPGEVAHTGTSSLLKTNSDYYDWAVFMCEMSAPTASHLLEATLKWPGSVERAETAYNAAFNTHLPFFQHLRQLPERQRQFSAYMKSVTNSEGTHLKHLVHGYGWAALGKALVVDVGGATGHASIALAEAYPSLLFVVQDLAEVIPSADAPVGTDERSTCSRLRFQAHNMFESQPISGADAYLLRMILHDWSDDDAVRILSNITSAMGERSRVLVMDTLLPDPGSVPASRERLLRLRDMTMMQVFNSRERGLSDWLRLFATADKRLKLLSVNQPFGSVMSLMELGLG